MGGGASQEKKEFAWCAEESKSCAQCIASEIKNQQPGLVQLVNMSIAHKASSLDQGLLGEQSKLEMRQKFDYAVKHSLPPPEDSTGFWILHFSPAILVTNTGVRKEAYIAIDRTALYVFVKKLESSWACVGGSTGQDDVLRVPFDSIRCIEADNNGQDFTVSAFTQLRNSANNAFQWKNATSCDEKAMKFHSLRRAEILRVLQGMLNVLYYGVPTNQRKYQWVNKPEAVASLQERVHPEYDQQCASTGCFEAKFLMHAVASTYADTTFVPEVWYATQPPYLHAYRAFHKPTYGSKAVIPRAPNGLYEMAAQSYDVEPITKPCPNLWAGVPLHHRITVSPPPPYRLPGVTAAAQNQLLASSLESTPGVLDILSLHGSDYAASSNTLDAMRVGLQSSHLEPCYSIDFNGAVHSGGLRWYAPGLGDARLVAQPEIIKAALLALQHDRSFHTLSFARCALSPDVDPRPLYPALADVCKHNSSLTSIDFPRHSDGYANGWKELSEALFQNQLPLFTSIDAGGTQLDDASLNLLLFSLVRLYDKTQLGLSPVSLCFQDNRITESSVVVLCDKLLAVADLSRLQAISFGGNAWATAGSAAALIKLLRAAPSLQRLDIRSRDHTFPLMSALAAALAESSCPLQELAVGGHALSSTEAEAWVTAVASLAQAKKTTLKKVIVRGVHLRAYLASRLVAALPAVELDLSEDAVSYDAPGGNFHLDESSLVRELKIAKNAYYVLHWWRVMPRCLVVLDLSDTQNTAGVQLFDALRDSLYSLNAPIALQSLSCARVAVPADQLSSFKELLEILLLSEYVKIKSLDISGCQGGPYGLACLGNCLRKNRTLTSLQCDGQAPRSATADVEIFRLAEGWKTLRGCFYGNKKLRELSYPWRDVIEYFRAVALEVEKGWKAAAALKQQIGIAHRSYQFDRKRAIIQSMIALKRTFLGIERTRCKTVQVLHEMYTAVESNASRAAELEALKADEVWASAKTDALLTDLSTKQDGLLGQLWAQLMKFASTQPLPPLPPPPAGGNEPGPPPPSTAPPPASAPQASPSAPSSYPARGGPHPSIPPSGTDRFPAGSTSGQSQSTKATTHTTRTAWDDISRSIASGPHLFTPGEFQRFVALVHSVGGHKDPKLGKILKNADRLTAKAAVKAAGYKRSPQRFATALKKTSPNSYARYDFLSSGDSSYDWYNYQNYVDYREIVRIVDNTAEGYFGSDHDHHRDFGGNPPQDGNNSNDPDVDRDPPASTEPNDPTEPADPGDPNYGDAPETEDPPDQENPGDGSGEGADTGAGRDEAGDAGQDVDDAVGMYAGAGPRDLPDGDPDQSHGPDAVRAGNRTRGELISKQCWLSASVEIQRSKPVLRVEAAKDLAARLRKCWTEAVHLAINQSADVLMKTLEYSSQTRFCCTKSRTQPSACTLVTQCSVDRLPKLRKQALGWGGRLSAAVYISTASAAERAAGLAAVQVLVRELDGDAAYEGELVVSVLYGHEDAPWLWDCTTPGAADGALYPINALRNLAASVVQSALLFLVDVDFVPSAGLEQWVQRAASEQDLLSRCDAGELLVVPAFERVVATVEDSAATDDLTLEAVCAGLEEGSVTAFHVKHFPAGHSPTNYSKWRELSAKPALLQSGAAPQYEVPYGDYYEPYVVMARRRFVPYDERFRGYGMNKCVHLRALAERGCTFHVLPGHFLVADEHEKSVAHQRTYGGQSGYRRHVVAAAYRAALRDIKAGSAPAVSKASARLLRQAGKGSQGGAMKTKAMALKKGVKTVLALHPKLVDGEQVIGGESYPVEAISACVGFSQLL